MPNRVPDINSSIWIKTNPENIIPAKKGAWFFRKGKSFYINHTGDVSGVWIQLPYKTVIIPRPPENQLIQFEYQCELFEKLGDGFFDQYKELLPKTNWKFKSYEDVFIPAFPRDFRWCFPVPTGSYDSVGEELCRSYDENFFYFKTGSVWYRTPISLYSFQGDDSGEQPSLYTNLPYVVSPRSLPVPTSSYRADRVSAGDQTYDDDFFYIKPSKWKRSQLDVYDDSKMTMF
jgi:hypothetical protein